MSHDYSPTNKSQRSHDSGENAPIGFPSNLVSDRKSVFNAQWV